MSKTYEEHFALVGAKSAVKSLSDDFAIEGNKLKEELDRLDPSKPEDREKAKDLIPRIEENIRIRTILLARWTAYEEGIKEEFDTIKAAL